jgi:hypothetical protein
MAIIKFPSRWTWSYTKVPTDSEIRDSPDPQDECSKNDFDTLNEPSEQSMIRANQSLSTVVLGIIVTSGLALVIFVSVLASKKAHQNTVAQESTLLCGNSSAEALSLGCTWDQLTWAWLPPNCPHYANDEFVQAGNWKFYTDPLGKQEAVGAAWTEGLDNKVALWGQRGEHLTHCIYMFLSLGQIIRDGTSYHQKLTSYEHVDLCSEILLEALRQDPNWDKVETSTGKVSYNEHC